MRLVYPRDGHHTFESSVFLLGSVEPGATLAVNGARVPVSEHGFFSWLLALTPGQNNILLCEERADGATQEQALRVTWATSMLVETLLASPVELGPFVWPFHNVDLAPGASFLMFCPGPEQAEVCAHIPELGLEAIRLDPLAIAPDNRVGVFASRHQMDMPWPTGSVYGVMVTLPHDAQTGIKAKVTYTLKTPQSTSIITAQGTLSVLSPWQGGYVCVETDEAVTRTWPHTGARRTPLLQGTYVRLLGSSGDEYCLRYGSQDSVWVPKADVCVLSGLPAFLPVCISLIQAGCEPSGLQVSIPMPYPVPMECDVEEDKIRLRLFGVVSQCDFIHYHPGVFGSGLRDITWEQRDTEEMLVTVRLQSPLYGVRRWFDPVAGEFRLNIKTRDTLRGKPLKVMLDPGHGGEECGATAPDGTPEKELNLQMALRIEALLKEDSRVSVHLTRRTDVTMSLAKRVQVAQDACADLLLSLHHNALPDGRDPMAEHGIATFFYYPFALPVARMFQHRLAEHYPFADYGVLYDSLYLCRVMAMPALLLELGFLTHPRDAFYALDDKHQHETSQAVANAIREFVQSIQPDSSNLKD